MEGISVFMYALSALIMAIIFLVLALQVPTLTDGNVSGNLTTIGIVTIFLGLFTFFAVTYYIPTSPDAVLYFNTFITHVVTLPLALFGLVAGASAVADAKKSLMAA